jgi:peptide deformylase
MKIVNYPHPALRAKSKPVTNIDKDLRIAAGQMLELMYSREGLGLAAPQVTLDCQMIVLNLEANPERKDLEIIAINPVILESKGSEKDREGCLSFPGLYQDIRRAKSVKVQFYDLDGKLQTMQSSGLAARLWQHEIDHLNGVLFIDKMGPLQRFGSRNDINTLLYEFDKDKKSGELPPDIEPKL